MRVAIALLMICLSACDPGNGVSVEVRVGDSDGLRSVGAGVEVQLVPLAATRTVDGSVRWRPEEGAVELVALTAADGRAVFDWLPTEPYRVRSRIPTADPTCLFIGSELVLDSAANVVLELNEACE